MVDFSAFKNNKIIQLDDKVKRNLDDYVTQWSAPDQSVRKWNIGYIRSTTHPELNEYGENLEDLFAIIKKAPEVKRCIAKRVFEYSTSTEQAMDAGYLDYLTDRFDKTATCQNSATAYKNLVKEVILSESFITRDPVADECYDYPPGYEAKDAAPCKVNAILERNCVSCHSPKSDESDLDLSHWVRQANGEMNFNDLDEGVQRAQKDTMLAIQNRLQTTKDDKRMPKNRYMNPLDRAALFNWTVEVLQQEQANSLAGEKK